MKQTLLSFLVPPYAACRYGCAGGCAAPIGVFWLAGIVSLIYGFIGGPANLLGVSWPTLGLGLCMWLIAVVWARVTIYGADQEKCEKKINPLCNDIVPKVDETDPFDEVRKAQKPS